MKPFALLLILPMLLCGCVAKRSAQTRSAEAVTAAHETTVRRAVTGPVTPNITVSGVSNVVTVTPAASHVTTEVTDQANTKGEASGDSRTSFRVGLSVWLAVGFAAFGVAALLIAWVVASNATASVKSADQGLGMLIDFASSTGAAAVVPMAEKIRGKLNRRR